jgi:predicted TIM-barrel fold metal-dependent hydrolase
VLPFIDTHYHMWDRAEAISYQILDDPAPHPIIGNIDGVRVRRFGPAEYEAQSRFQAVSKTIHVTVASEELDLLKETRWLSRLHDETGFPDALIGRADLSHPNARKQLEEHAQFPLLRGLRGVHSVDEINSTQWRKGYAELETYDLIFCHPFSCGDSEIARRLAAEYPGVTLCIDQAGLPARRDQDYFAGWRQGMDIAAEPPNTVCKISSLGMRDQRWTVDSLRPWVEGCLEAFGVDRCFFGTNWPMDSLFSSYPDLVNAYRQLVSQYSADEQASLLAGNAARIFRL